MIEGVLFTLLLISMLIDLVDTSEGDLSELLSAIMYTAVVTDFSPPL